MSQRFQIRLVQPTWLVTSPLICRTHLETRDQPPQGRLNTRLTCNACAVAPRGSYPLSANAGNGDFPRRLNRSERRLEMQRGAQGVFPRPAGKTRARGCGIRARAGAGDSCRESDSTGSYRVLYGATGQGEMIGLYRDGITLSRMHECLWGCSAFGSNPSCPLRYPDQDQYRYIGT